MICHATGLWVAIQPKPCGANAVTSRAAAIGERKMKALSVDRRTALGGLGALAAASAIKGRSASAAAPVQMISHRYPALELYAEKMRSAVPGVEVNTQLMPFDKANELATIALSSKADTVDLVYASDSTVQKYAKNGWLRPLDDLWEKYKAEYNFSDFPEAAWNLTGTRASST